jgi:hypothetical protein
MIAGEPPHYNCIPSIAIELIKSEDPVVPEEYKVNFRSGLIAKGLFLEKLGKSVKH